MMVQNSDFNDVVKQTSMIEKKTFVNIIIIGILSTVIIISYINVLFGLDGHS